MNCRLKSKEKHSSAVFAVTALVLLCMHYGTAAASAGNAPGQLDSIEQAIVGSTNSKLSIEKRVKELEIKVFAKVQPGSLSTRISGLEKFAGLSGNSPVGKTPSTVSASGMMPPLPPQFDNGQDGIKQAPNHLSPKDMTDTARKLEEAVKLHHSGKTAEAEQSLRVILANNPKNSDAYFSLGAIAESRGDLKTALEYYTSAMQANPNDSEAHDAVAELSRKIATSASQPFYNPLGPAPEVASSKVLQGRAWELGANGTANNGLQGQSTFSAPNIPTANISGRQCIPTAGVTPPARQSAGTSFGRSLARAALGAALSGTGLHCPVCHMLNGF